MGEERDGQHPTVWPIISDDCLQNKVVLQAGMAEG